MTSSPNRRDFLTAAAALLVPGVAWAAPARKPTPGGDQYLEIPPREVAERTLAFRWANATNAEVQAELGRLRIPWVPSTPPFPGVRFPIRLAGPIRGVFLHGSEPPEVRVNSIFEMLDARLAIALWHLCGILREHDVVELVHFTMYRPPRERIPPGAAVFRHPAGLAIDVGALKKADGTWMSVGVHWPSAIGHRSCGAAAKDQDSRVARELQSIACECLDARIFHYTLTPHYDGPHADHLHMELRPDTRWFMVR